MTVKSKKRLWVFAVLKALWLGFIYSNSIKSRASSSAQSKPLEELIRPPLEAIGVDKNADRVAELLVRKCAHVAEFFVLAVLCILVMRALGKGKKQSLGIAAVLSVLAAGIDEVLQIFSNRGAALTDVLIDSLGVFLAVAAFAMYYKTKKAAE